MGDCRVQVWTFFVLPRFVHTFPRRTKTRVRNSLHYGEDDNSIESSHVRATPTVLLTFSEGSFRALRSSSSSSRIFNGLLGPFFPFESLLLSEFCQEKQKWWVFSVVPSCPTPGRKKRRMVPGKSRSCRLQRGQLTAQMLTVLILVDRWPPERPHAPCENISCDSTHQAFLAGESRAPLNYLCFDVIRLSPGENPKYCVGFGGLVGHKNRSAT